LASTPTAEVREQRRRGADGLPTRQGADWEPERKIGFGRKIEGGEARTESDVAEKERPVKGHSSSGG
jgi:hypothetical protein